MAAGDLYRIEYREQNQNRKYYLIREICTDNRKFTASHLITAGTPPTKTEVKRCASHYGSDLELKCVAKAAKFRTGRYLYDRYDDADAVYEIEQYRLLWEWKSKLTGNNSIAEYISTCHGVSLSPDDVKRLLFTGIIPRGMTLAEVNIVQNLNNAVCFRDRKPLSAAKIYKVHKELSRNLSTSPLSPEFEPKIARRLKEFYAQIKDRYYPFEQCLLFYLDLQDLLPNESRLVDEIYARLLKNYGYNLLPSRARTWEETILFVHEENPILQFDIRRLNEMKFKVISGGKQKQLDLF
ncbi:MAG TPA: hypothetical protein O0X32_02935 [Methanocorpusculum sp.]|nr:hypothetical protein [Methanocorpusculum sp.]